MLTEEIFYSVFWISTISVIWFYTDWFLQYGKLLGVADQLRLEYLCFIIDYPDKYFPDFLHEKSKESNNSIINFLGKLVSCPFCLLLWFAIAAALICSNFIITAPVYIFSLIITLQIKKMI